MTKAQMEKVSVPCCQYLFTDGDHPVKWNPFNGVVQCHNCGHIWEPAAAPVEAERTAAPTMAQIEHENMPTECGGTFAAPTLPTVEQIEAIASRHAKCSEYECSEESCGTIRKLCDMALRAESLQAEVERLKWRTEKLQSDYDDLRTKNIRMFECAEQSERKLAEAVAALRKYGRHSQLCSVVGGYVGPCTCGFDEVTK